MCNVSLAFLSAGWTVKSKTSFNKLSPVTVLGHSYLLNSEGERRESRDSDVLSNNLCPPPLSSPVLRASGALPSGLCVAGLADLQEGVPPAGGLHLDHRLWVGLHAAQRTDAVSTGPPGPFDAQRSVPVCCTRIFLNYLLYFFFNYYFHK